jgi:hypothetical protein
VGENRRAAPRVSPARSSGSRGAAPRMNIPVFLTLTKSGLALENDFGTIDWVKEYPHPNVTLQQIKQLLGEPA